MAHRAGLAMLSSRHREALRFAGSCCRWPQAAGDTDVVRAGLMVRAISPIGTGHVEEGLSSLREHLDTGERDPRCRACWA